MCSAFLFIILHYYIFQGGGIIFSLFEDNKGKSEGYWNMNNEIIKINSDVSIRCGASIVGADESEGPLSRYFDICEKDAYFGQETWEKAESEMVRRTVGILLGKAELDISDVGCALGGDLLNQCVATGYCFSGFDVPYFGLYGACSTAAEGLVLGSLICGGGYSDRVITVASSHFSSSERQFRYPVEYAGQRTPTSQQTVTGCGAFLLERGGGGPYITEVVIGKVVDKGITDANNMGAAMAPAAADTILRYFRESGKSAKDFDMIVTGDLAFEGTEILKELLHFEKFEHFDRIYDCGMMIFDRVRQDVHSGGSGCGCSASVVASYILHELENGADDVLFVGTGAMMSPLAILQGRSIPSIAHLVHISSGRKR